MKKEQIISEFQDKLTSEQLSEVILFFDACEAYYNSTDGAIMSDPQFDALQEQLIDYGVPELTKLIESSIYVDVEGLEEVPDETQEMISLNKLKYKDRSSVVEIKQFFPDRSKNLFYAPKLDGAALKIIWDFSNPDVPFIKQILSRGGLDVTNLFKPHPDVLTTKKYKKQIIAGELVIDKQVFLEKYSTEGDNEYEYENARNFVGSIIKQKEISKEILNDLNFIQCTDGKNPLDYQFLWHPCTANTLYDLEKIVKFYKSDEFPFLCDGIVLSYFEEGPRQIKNNYPLNMLAVKFPAPQAKTKVTGFEWSQKKSGKLTPVVLIEHTKLEGSTITKANGYNYQNLLDLHIGIGSEIMIEKSGDIIPVVVKVLSYSKNIILPECDYIHKGKHLIAINMEESRKYKFILGLRLLQLDGIGETLAEKVGEVVNYEILDVFNETFKPKICGILGGGVVWQKFSRVYQIRSLHLDILIALLQFNGVGPVIAKKIAMIITQKSNDTSNISGEILQNVCRGEGFQKISSAIIFLKAHNVKVLSPIEINDETITFEMTQDPGGMTKSEFVKKFQEQYPNAVHTTLTKETKYLFCSDISVNTGKLNKARKYNVKIVTYTNALKGDL